MRGNRSKQLRLAGLYISNFWTDGLNWINFRHMKRTTSIAALGAFAIFLGTLPAMPVAGQDSATKPVGQLVLFADTAVFADPTKPPSPDNCTLRNRFKKGDIVGFRLYAVDGGTDKSEDSAKVVVHISTGGKTYDLPALFRGLAQKNEVGGNMPIRPGMWTAKWRVPGDAPTGTVHYSATATDKYGRMTEWKPQGGEPSFVTIVE
jgi:hypothetical protein